VPTSIAPVSIQLVIFDMDDVLARLDRVRRLDMLAEMTGKTPAFLHETIWGSDFESGAEAGAYPTGAEYLEEFNHRTGCRLSRADWIRARREAMTPDHEVLDIVATVKELTMVAMLTNNGSLLRASLGEIFPEAVRLFGRRAHASFEFGARKPDPAVFERLLARYAIPAPAAVFIDDAPDFVAGARNAGLHAIRFTDAQTLRGELAKFGLA
jgi:HAD superfamily hydrolase (TIGR01509 family)